MGVLWSFVLDFWMIYSVGQPPGNQRYHRRLGNGTSRYASWGVLSDSLSVALNNGTIERFTFLLSGLVGFVFGRQHRVYLLPSVYTRRNQQIFNAVRAAVQSPRTPSFRLIECEFPAVAQLNKLGDGSLRSSQAVNDANFDTAQSLVRGLTGPALLPGPIVWLVTSSAAGATSVPRANTLMQHSLQNGLPPVKSRDVCVLLAPCNRQDYEAAKRLAENGNTVVLVNGFAKVGQYRPCFPNGRDAEIQFEYLT